MIGTTRAVSDTARCHGKWRGSPSGQDGFLLCQPSVLGVRAGLSLKGHWSFCKGSRKRAETLLTQGAVGCGILPGANRTQWTPVSPGRCHGGQPLLWDKESPTQRRFCPGSEFYQTLGRPSLPLENQARVLGLGAAKSWFCGSAARRDPECLNFPSIEGQEAQGLPTGFLLSVCKAVRYGTE